MHIMVWSHPDLGCAVAHLWRYTPVASEVTSTTLKNITHYLYYQPHRLFMYPQMPMHGLHVIHRTTILCTLSSTNLRIPLRSLIMVATNVYTDPSLATYHLDGCSSVRSTWHLVAQRRRSNSLIQLSLGTCYVLVSLSGSTRKVNIILTSSPLTLFLEMPNALPCQCITSVKRL